MKIGIIGSNGFIGKNLFDYLSRQSNFIIYKFSSFKKNKNNWIGMVSKEIKNFKPDIIINCAASQVLSDDKKSITKLLNSNLYSNILFLNEATNYKSFKGYITFEQSGNLIKTENFTL